MNLEPVTLLGGSRALLLQVAHPLVAAGVARHSNYLKDPWRRLFRTLDVMVKLGFGSPATSEQQRRRLRRAHAHVTGTSPDDMPYQALDPELMMWVLATLVDTSLLVYERVFGPLSRPDRERYYQESRDSAAALGIAERCVPATWHEFGRYMDRMVAEQLRVTPEAMAVARSTFAVPRPPVLGPIVGKVSRLFAAGLLPQPIRRAYAIGWDERHERRLGQAFAVARWVSRMTPARIRRFPIGYVAQHPDSSGRSGRNNK